MDKGGFLVRSPYKIRKLVKHWHKVVFAFGSVCTVETHKLLHHKSLRFAIFWEIFNENCQLKTLLNSKNPQIVTVFLKVFFVTIYGSRLYTFMGHSVHVYQNLPKLSEHKGPYFFNTKHFQKKRIGIPRNIFC